MSSPSAICVLPYDVSLLHKSPLTVLIGTDESARASFARRMQLKCERDNPGCNQRVFASGDLASMKKWTEMAAAIPDSNVQVVLTNHVNLNASLQVFIREQRQKMAAPHAVVPPRRLQAVLYFDGDSSKLLDLHNFQWLLNNLESMNTRMVISALSYNWLDDALRAECSTVVVCGRQLHRTDTYNGCLLCSEYLTPHTFGRESLLRAHKEISNSGAWLVLRRGAGAGNVLQTLSIGDLPNSEPVVESNENQQPTVTFHQKQPVEEQSTSKMHAPVTHVQQLCQAATEKFLAKNRELRAEVKLALEQIAAAEARRADALMKLTVESANFSIELADILASAA